MSSEPYIVETAILLLVAFVLGGAVGFWARRWFAPQAVADTNSQDVEKAPEPVSEAAPKQAAPPRPAAPMDAEPAAEPEPKPASAEPGKPALLSAAREGTADDLKKIKGIGPKIEKTLNGLGVYHYDQIAGWDDKAIAWVDDQLSFHGRIEREGWVTQARALTKTS